MSNRTGDAQVHDKYEARYKGALLQKYHTLYGTKLQKALALMPIMVSNANTAT
jgi:hypothetical protein